MCVLLFAISLLLIIIVPLLSNHGKMDPLFLQYMIVTSPSLLVITAFYSSFISENNAMPGERTFIFTRPISRNVYLSAKILSSLTFTLIISFLVCFMILISLIMCHQQGVIYDTKYGVGAIFSVLVFATFGSVCGTCFRFYIKEKLTSVGVMLIVVLFTILLTSIGAKELEMSLFLLLYFDILIPAIFIPLIIIAIYFGYYFMRRANVEI
jgi:hypothetical protein